MYVGIYSSRACAQMYNTYISTYKYRKTTKLTEKLSRNLRLNIIAGYGRLP